MGLRSKLTEDRWRSLSIRYAFRTRFAEGSLGASTLSFVLGTTNIVKRFHWPHVALKTRNRINLFTSWNEKKRKEEKFSRLRLPLAWKWRRRQLPKLCPVFPLIWLSKNDERTMSSTRPIDWSLCWWTVFKRNDLNNEIISWSDIEERK